MSSDRIEKSIVLGAPRSRVWRAIADAEEFGTWFLIKLEGGFAPGARIHGQVLSPGYEHLTVDLWVERMEPERLFSYRWHPGGDEDHSGEPTTLVEFRLEDVPEGTRLTVVESGFDNIPLHRRAVAFRENEAGWAAQLENIERYVSA